MATQYQSQEAVHRFYDSVEREVAQTVGVRSVAIGGPLPLDGMWTGQGIDMEGDPPRQGPSRNLVSYHMVSPTYFETLDIPIVSGRTFCQTDAGDAVQVCIVSELFVQRYLNGRNPIGLRVNVPAMGFPTRPVLREIVGVVRQIKMWPNEPQPIASTLRADRSELVVQRVSHRDTAGRLGGGTASGRAVCCCAC